MAGWTLGIETTAHTLSFGLVDHNGILILQRAIRSGLTKAAFILERLLTTTKTAAMLFQRVLEEHDLSTDDIGAVAYSQGPGLGPCLRVGAAIARGLATRMDVPLIGVNHCVAHIEIGRQQCGCETPSCCMYLAAIRRSLLD